LPTHEALRIAEEGGLDLVEVSPKAFPPVCKIMDYGKFKYEDSKKKKEARKHQTVVMLKEVKFRPKTDDHDLDFKLKHIRRFLLEGNKAKLVIVFRGREIVHPETGRAMLDRVIQALTDIAVVEQIPLMEGRRMAMVIAPKVAAVPGKPAATVVRPMGAPAAADGPSGATVASATPRPSRPATNASVAAQHVVVRAPASTSKPST
jgi:translation initiation factor IF-3